MSGKDDETGPKLSLFSMLPKPKNPAFIKEKSKPSTFLKPSSVSRPAQPTPTKNTESLPDVKVQGVKRPLVAYDSDVSDSDEEIAEKKDKPEKEIDFFGLDSKDDDKEIPSTSLINDMEVEHRLSDSFIGPARPNSEDIKDDYPDDDVNPPTSNFISEEQAKKMIYDRELAPFGVSSMAASAAVANMIDVSVDKALGPNIQANLLKNLNSKAMAQVSIGPLPKIKRDPKDKLSKQKHQITHLATLAVAREEQLQEQWAEGRTKKRQTARKYGF